MARSAFSRQVLAAVRQIPAGRVASYGQVATWLGSPRAARAVGAVLSGLKWSPPEQDIPWHRVINSRGRVSAPGDTHRYRLQTALLESEGVVFDASGACDLDLFRWVPDDLDVFVDP